MTFHVFFAAVGIAFALLLVVQTVYAVVAVHRLAKREREHDKRFLLAFGNDRATMQRVYGGLLK